MTSDPPTDGALAALGLKLVNVVVGAVSSFVALRFFEGLHPLEKWTTFVGGWSVAAWGATPLAEWLSLSPKVEIGLVLMLGLFGMAVAAECLRLVRSLNWETLKGLIRK